MVFAGEVKSNIIPDAAATYDLGSAAKAWRAGYFDDVVVDGLSVGNISVTGSFINDQIEIVGNRIATFRSNADLELDTAGTGTIELLTNTNVTGDFTVSNDATVNRDLTVKRNVSIEGNYLTTTQTSFYVFDGTATTVSAFGAAETLAFASSTGTTTFRSDVVINNDLQIKGGDLTTNATTFNLFNADASTINAFGAASTIDIGRPSSGRTNIKHDLKVDGSLEVVGDITLGGSINIGDANTDNVVFGADVNSSIIPNIASAYDLGSASKTWRSGYFDDLFVDGISVQSITVTGSYANDQIEIIGNQIKTFRSNADLEFDTAGTGQVVVLGQSGVVMPIGNTAERPTPPRTGTLRFNTDDARFENYNGEEWNRMIHDDDAIAFAIALG